jgi:O-antigen ligase
MYLLHVLAVPALALSNALLGLTVLAAAWRVDWKRTEWPRLRPLYLPLAVYVVLLAGAIAASTEPRVSLRGASEVFSLATLFLGPLLLRGERILKRAVDAVIAMGGLSALWGLAQLAFGFGDLDRRIRGPFSHWMTFAGILLVCNFLVLARLVVEPRSRRLWRGLALLAINLGLIASLTRSAWLAAAITAGGLLIALRPRWLVGLLPAAVFVVLLAPVPVLSRAGSVADPRDASNYDRLCMLEAGLRMVRERPLFGIGPELVRQRYSLYRHPTAPRYEVPHLHNNLIELAAERGLPAALSYVWLMGAAIWLGFKRYRGEGGERGPAAGLYLGSALALIAFNLAGLFEFNWGDIEVQRLVLFVAWIPLAGMGGADREAGQETEAP